MTIPAPRGRPYRIAMVCLGNICRSPMGAAVLSDRVAAAGLADAVAVVSAGTGDWHIGEQADPRARAALRRRGYDGEQHRARQFDRSWFADVDLVLAFDHANVEALTRLAPDQDARGRVRLLRSFDPQATPADDVVPDPYWGGDQDFDHGLDLIERSVDHLLGQLRPVVDPR